MYTIIGGDGKEYGPVPAEQVRAWIAGGRADLKTRIKVLGTDEWKTIGEFPEFEAGAIPPLRPTVHLDAGDASFIANVFVERAGKLDIISCYERSWRLLLTHFWPLVGVTALILVLNLAVSLIPVVRIAGQLGLAGVFMGGLQYFILQNMRGHPPDCTTPSPASVPRCSR